jgi:hypothetical protein
MPINDNWLADNFTLEIIRAKVASASAAFARSISPFSAWRRRDSGRIENAKTGVDGLAGRFDRGIKIAQAEFSVRHQIVPMAARCLTPEIQRAPS